MMKFFRNNIKLLNVNVREDLAQKNKGKNTLSEIEKLGNGNNVNDLKETLKLVKRFENEHAGGYNKINFLKGEIAAKHFELTHPEEVSKFKIIKKN